jgi:hypothetical protein
LLFEGCNFYFHGNFQIFDKKELEKLVKLAGGSLIKREPKVERINEEEVNTRLPYHLDKTEDKTFRCSNFIIFDVTKHDIIKSPNLMTAQPKWLFNCIDRFKILKPQ